MQLQEILGNTIVAGAISGFIAASTVDIVAFRNWKSFDDAAKYAWNVAYWRWFQGTVSGALTALGIAGLT